MKLATKSFLLPLGITVTLYLLLQPLARWYYWDSGLSSIVPTIRRPAGLTIHDVPVALLVAGIVFWLKFFIYDTFGRLMLRRLHGSRQLTWWFYGVYMFGFAIDAFSLFMASRPLSGAGFASLGTILYTPVVLALGLAVMGVALLYLRPSTSQD